MSGMSGEEDFLRADIWSRVATGFVRSPMYKFFSMSRDFQSSEYDVTSLHNLYITRRPCQAWHYFLTNGLEE